jgi:hypothetical protein
MRTCYHYLHGTKALVLSELTLINAGDPWQLHVMAIKPCCPEDRFLWVLPEHLMPVSLLQADAFRRANLQPQLAVRQSHGELLRSTVRHPFPA